MVERKVMEPFAVTIDLQSGRVSPPANLLVRRLSDLDGLFADQAAYEEAMRRGDPVVYEVYEIKVPEEEGHLLSCTTIIYPGKIGQEYYFTRGHYHVREDTAEIYTCLGGEGYLLMATRQGLVRSIYMAPGTCAYIPPRWCHRTLNCGREPFVFHGVWPGNAGHDYQSVAGDGFPLRVFEEGGRAVVRPGRVNL